MILIKIIVITPYGIYPPISGGSLRVHNINTELSKNNTIFLFSQGIRRTELTFPLKSLDFKIDDQYTEHRYADMVTTAVNYLLMKKRLPQIFSGDILKVLRPRILTKHILDSDIIHVELPWQFKYMSKNNPNHLPIILTEENVEFKLLEQQLSPNINCRLIKISKEKERYAVENADKVIVTCEADRLSIINEFAIKKDKISIVPNGVDTTKFYPISDHERELAKKYLGFNDKKIVLFSGSVHEPNQRAVNEILKMAKQINNKIIFLIVGNVRNKPETIGNVIFTGPVDDVIKYFKAADISINPMTSGSGTNLKMLEYFASGLPTISTAIGARGIDITDGVQAIISEINDFPEHIKDLLSDENKCNNLREKGRQLVVDKYDWKTIAQIQNGIYYNLIS